MNLTSPVFKQGGLIPQLYTCEGENISPPLQIGGIPDTAEALVLIVDDPDVPEFVRKDRLWVHWVVYNIPPQTTQIAENASPPGILGRGTGGKQGYQGPCPPDREHRYRFKLYALDAPLALEAGASKDEVEKAMNGHLLDHCELMGRYRLQLT